MTDSTPPSVSRSESALQSKRRPRIPLRDLIPSYAARTLRYKQPSAKITKLPDKFRDIMKLIEDLNCKVRAMSSPTAQKVMSDLLLTFEENQREHQQVQMYLQDGTLDKAVNHRWSNAKLDKLFASVKNLEQLTLVTTTTIDLEFAKFLQTGLSLIDTPETNANDQVPSFSDALSRSQPDTPRHAHLPNANDQGSFFQASLSPPNTPRQARYPLTKSDRDLSFLQTAVGPPQTPQTTLNDYHDPGEKWPTMDMKWPRNLTPTSPLPTNPSPVISIEIDPSVIRNRLHLRCCIGDDIDA